MVSSEKYNLDQSSGDNSMEEDDALESKLVVPKSSPDEVVDRKVKTEVPVVEVAAPAGDMQGDISVDNGDSHDDTKNAPDAPTVKRMLHGKLVGVFFPLSILAFWWPMCMLHYFLVAVVLLILMLWFCMITFTSHFCHVCLISCFYRPRGTWEG